MKRVQYLPLWRAGGTAAGRGDATRRGAGPNSRSGRAAAANPMDWKIRRGEIKALSGFRFPRGLGHDFAGVVGAVGRGWNGSRWAMKSSASPPSVKRARSPNTSLQTKKTLGSSPSISFGQAAALTLVSVTAWNALAAKAGLRAGQSVFITGCLGGVGRSAVQIARMRGANVVGSCSASGREEALALGVGEVVDYRAFDIARINIASTWSSIRQARCR